MSGANRPPLLSLRPCPQSATEGKPYDPSRMSLARYGGRPKQEVCILHQTISNRGRSEAPHDLYNLWSSSFVKINGISCGKANNTELKNTWKVILSKLKHS